MAAPRNTLKVKLCIKDQEGEECYYRVYQKLKLKKLFLSYCDKKKLDYETVVFLYNEKRIRPSETPQMLGMVDEDEIDVMRHQSGGGLAS